MFVIPALFLLLVAPLIILQDLQNDSHAATRDAQIQEQTPGPRLGHSMLYDRRMGGVLLIDGAWPESSPGMNRIWRWDGKVWQPVGSLDQPNSAMGAAVVDSRRKLLITYGGRANAKAIGTLSEWGTGRNTRGRDETPGARFHHSMAYDSARGRTVMYGGATSEGWDTATWEWDGSRWRRFAVPGPGARAAFRMVYDSRRRAVVLFGGSGPPRGDGQPQEFLNDTWVWNGTSWRRASTEGPAGRRDYSMAFDSRRGVVLLYGGAAGNGEATQRFADLWEWNGERWKEIPQQGPHPAHRYVSAMAYDAGRDRTVLYGGYSCASMNESCGVLGDTWEWDASSWRRVQ